MWRRVGVDTGENFDGQLRECSRRTGEEKKKQYLFARDVVSSQSDLTHTTCTERFAEGVIAKDAPTGSSWRGLFFSMFPAFPAAVLIRRGCRRMRGI